jgi:hypothetical protein
VKFPHCAATVKVRSSYKRFPEQEIIRVYANAFRISASGGDFLRFGMKKNYITIGILIALVAAFAVSRVGHTGYPRMQTNAGAAPATAATSTAPIPLAASSSFLTIPAPTRLPPMHKTPTSAPAPVPASNVTLKAADQTYETYISGNESVLDLMNTVASSSTFTFTGENYPSLGFFVESINGENNGHGLYWILYVNGKSSDLGASSEIIKPGDTVEWRFESGN